MDGETAASSGRKNGKPQGRGVRAGRRGGDPRSLLQVCRRALCTRRSETGNLLCPSDTAPPPIHAAPLLLAQGPRPPHRKTDLDQDAPAKWPGDQGGGVQEGERERKTRSHAGAENTRSPHRLRITLQCHLSEHSHLRGRAGALLLRQVMALNPGEQQPSSRQDWVSAQRTSDQPGSLCPWPRAAFELSGCLGGRAWGCSVSPGVGKLGDGAQQRGEGPGCPAGPPTFTQHPLCCLSLND